MSSARCVRVVYVLWVIALVTVFSPVPLECWRRRCAYADLPLMFSLVFALGLLPFGALAWRSRRSVEGIGRAALTVALAAHALIVAAGLYRYLPYLLAWIFALRIT